MFASMPEAKRRSLHAVEAVSVLSRGTVLDPYLYRGPKILKSHVAMYAPSRLARIERSKGRVVLHFEEPFGRVEAEARKV